MSRRNKAGLKCLSVRAYLLTYVRTYARTYVVRTDVVHTYMYVRACVRTSVHKKSSISMKFGVYVEVDE